MSKKVSSIIEPTDSELSLYKQLIADIDDSEMDKFTNEYFDLVSKEEIKVSFPKFIIDKMIRPIKPGDTISFMDEENEEQFLYCLVRTEVEENTYLIFSMVNKELETIDTENIFLFIVDGYDEDGIEIIDILPSDEETDRILSIIEGDSDVELVKAEDIQIKEEK